MKKDNKGFWNRYAKIYDFEINRFNGPAYEQMYKSMAGVLTKEMKVLELATGTGLIAVHIADTVKSIEATDFSPKMIDAAKKKAVPSNVHLSIEDASALSFPDQSFDAAIISNALHIMPDPKIVLQNIRRVLKPNGILIAPTFSHGHISNSSWKLNTSILKLIGFETYSKWSPTEYVSFIEENGFRVKKWEVLKAAFPLVYLEAELID